MRSRLLLAVALAAGVALPSIACKQMAERAREKAEEKAIEQQTGGQVKLDNEKGTMTIVTDAGAMTLGTGARLPDDFPKAVPAYPGAAVQFAAKTSNAGKDAWSAAFETTDSKDKVAAFYKSNLSGFTQASSMDLGESIVQAWQSPKLDVSLIVASDSAGKTSITMGVTAK
jgi:hypothetical protein